MFITQYTFLLSLILRNRIKSCRKSLFKIFSSWKNIRFLKRCGMKMMNKKLKDIAAIFNLSNPKVVSYIRNSKKGKRAAWVKEWLILIVLLNGSWSLRTEPNIFIVMNYTFQVGLDNFVKSFCSETTWVTGVQQKTCLKVLSKDQEIVQKSQ